jgi:hypothetical protein
MHSTIWPRAAPVRFTRAAQDHGMVTIAAVLAQQGHRSWEGDLEGGFSEMSNQGARW